MKPDVGRGHVIIERIEPCIDGGRFRAKAIVGDVVEVTADIFRDGPDLLQAVLRAKPPGSRKWVESPMTPLVNDRWSGSFSPDRIGVWRYTIEAWTDHFATWRRNLIKKVEVHDDIELELEEGARLIEARLPKIPAKERKLVAGALTAIREEPGKDRWTFSDPRVVAALSDVVGLAMQKHPDRNGSSTSEPALELYVDRERARYGAWYEFFPRSTGTKTKHGTFKTAAKLLPKIADMGFDVVYLPPIHPIGTAFRKGRNNTLTAEKGDVGSPWAIGNKEGGHTAVHPQLGTIDDFDAFVAEAERNNLEVALDYAIQASPDHPWVKEHPEWFHHRPDGSIRYAENPPKKYQDVYHVNFDNEKATELWLELKGILDFWIDHGVKIFRVDNPHTKPFPFWEWVIEEIHKEHPDVIFLAEAFTRPKVMQQLAKLGFTQSYTYFTWRNTKHELIEYMTELTQTEMRWYFRPNFFVNTPDILHEYLQTGGPPAFKIRLVLAALLSPTYGIYSGYELFENTPVKEGSEEYLDSEKYELKPRDINSGPNLVQYIRTVNDIRRKHPALSEMTNLVFHHCDKDNMLAFSRSSVDGDTILAIVNLNPFHWEETTVHLDLEAMGVDPYHPFEVRDLVTGENYVWHGPHNYVKLDPHYEPAHIFEIGG
ncbi:MAG: maltotransferase domain-containing protein [Actinomycetota bacterium]